MEQLTTPEMISGDSSYPGENWFFYWKSSPSLWESKLQSFPHSGPIFVPLYWGLHSEYKDQYDFGESKPETDLKRLFDAASKTGKELVLILPLGPTPFLVNGGIPSYLAQTLSKDKDGLVVASLDHTNSINKMYSFYDPNIYRGFSQFVTKLGRYLTISGISAPVFGMNSFFRMGHKFVSFFEDRSSTFEKGLNRYIKQLQESEPAEIQKLIADKSYENVLIDKYSLLIQNLYIDMAQETLAGSFSGVTNINFIGSGSHELFTRTSSFVNESTYFGPSLESVVQKMIPSSILLKEEDKKSVLSKLLKDFSTPDEIRNNLGTDFFGETELSLRPLANFELVQCSKNEDALRHDFSQSGLEYFFNQKYPWMYRISKFSSDVVEDEDLRKVFFFFGQDIEDKGFHKMLKLFMSGGKVFLDRHKIDEKYLNKIEVFMTENNLSVEDINFMTPVRKISLGQGTFIIYDSSFLIKSSLIKRSSFWDSIISYLDIKHLNIDTEKGIYYFWKVRGSNTYELSYEEVRRVFFYNPTSYKRKAHIPVSSNFAYIKNVDLKNVEVKSTPTGVDLLMLPGGTISIDYGFYE